MTADDYSERGLRIGVSEDAAVKPNDKFTTDGEVAGQRPYVVGGQGRCVRHPDRGDAGRQGFRPDHGQEHRQGLPAGNAITDASKVTITGWEAGSEPHEFTLTLGGTYTGEKATFQNVDDSHDLSAQGWTCQYVHGIDTQQQCAVFGPAELPADGLKVTYTIDPSFSDGVVVPKETVQAVADALYEGHAVD